MRSTIGVVFLAREILAKKDITQHPKRLSVLIHLMAWAQFHDNETIYWRGEPRQLIAGEVLTTLRELEKETRIEYQSVNRILKYLEKRNTITQEVTQHGRLIKLINFELYQDFQQVNEKQKTKKRKTNEKPMKNQRKTNETILSNNPSIQLSNKFFDLYYDNFTTNKQRAEMTESRIKKINKFVTSKYDLDYWQRVMEEIKKSYWLMRNGSGFRFNIDWLFQKHKDSGELNHLRIMEGFYNKSEQKLDNDEPDIFANVYREEKQPW